MKKMADDEMSAVDDVFGPAESDMGDIEVEVEVSEPEDPDEVMGQIADLVAQLHKLTQSAGL